MEGLSPSRISVITPTRARPDLLLAKARTVVAQTLPRSAFEWIVAFDGHAPSLERRLRDEVGDRIDLRTVSTDPVGRGPARDLAAAEATADVLYLSDDDCLLEPTTLERHLAAHAEKALWLGDIVFVGERDERTWSPRSPGWWNVGGANASIPKASFEAVGGFGSELSGYGGEDLWLGWRLVRSGLEVRWLPDAAVRHMGPDPQRSGDVARARQAGANAVRLAAMDSRMGWRLGVHPALVRTKLAVLPLLAPVLGPRLRGDLAYARGAWSQWKALREETP